MSSQGNDASIHITRDGSHSMYSETFRQFYHNPNGAYSESLHVFFEQSGLIESLRQNRPVSVFEVGFGTGLNAVILADLAETLDLQSEILFESVEAWPIPASQAESLNFARFCKIPEIAQNLPIVFKSLENGALFTGKLGRVNLAVHRCTFDRLTDENLLHRPYSHIFHDPFSPEVNRELWSDGVFEKLRKWSMPDAMLSTYCAAVPARAAMAAAGWFVAKTVGALGKREMTLASPQTDVLSRFKRVNEEKLAQRWKSGGFLG